MEKCDKILKKITRWGNFRTSPDIIRVIKSKCVRWAGHIGRIEQLRCVYKIFVRSPEGRDNMGELGVGGKVILKWVLRKHDVNIFIRFIWFRIQSSGWLP
jgi:hypothetical protein